MTSAPRERSGIRDALVLAIAIGIGAGLLIAALDVLFGIAVHPALAGLVAGVAIGVVFARRSSSTGG